jgi:beta-RFAP synthase
MIDSPSITVRALPATRWTAQGPFAKRALSIAEQLLTSFGLESPNLPARQLVIESSAREHVGLGVGTQLALAVARALISSWEYEESIPRLARRAGRGARSSLGVHGFMHGGFLVEGGKLSPENLSPLIVRHPVPDDWRILMIVPVGIEGTHGTEERTAFERVLAPLEATESLCRLVLLGLLPALIEGNLHEFGEALHDFNARVGELFSREQAGTYASPMVASLVAFLRQQGVRGVGQSSWGPGVFAFLADENQARDLAERAHNFLCPTSAEIWISKPSNRGAYCETS